MWKKYPYIPQKKENSVSVGESPNKSPKHFPMIFPIEMTIFLPGVLS
jgi:hypothetical protein